MDVYIVTSWNRKWEVGQGGPIVSMCAPNKGGHTANV